MWRADPEVYRTTDILMMAGIIRRKLAAALKARVRAGLGVARSLVTLPTPSRRHAKAKPNFSSSGRAEARRSAQTLDPSIAAFDVVRL